MREFRLNNVPVVVDPVWSISEKLNARSTMSVKMIDTLADNGDKFELYDDATLLFSGVVKKSNRYERTPGQLVCALKVSDNSALAEKRTIAKVYVNQYAGDIVKDIIATVLTEETVTEGMIEDGPIIKKAVFNYSLVSQALDYLKTVTGFVWNIGHDRALNFHSRTLMGANFDLTDSVQHNSFSNDTNMDQYRNTQYIRGGFTETSTQPIITQAPDGVNRTFTLRFPVSSKPDIYINAVQVNPNDIGINGLDTGKKWYYTYNSITITQDPSQPVLVPSDVISGSFKGLRRLFIAADSPVGVDDRKANEAGTSGKYEKFQIEQSLDNASAATAYAFGLLETFGQITDRVSYVTNIAGLKVGVTQRITKMLYGINEDFLIESIDITPNGPSNLNYNVSALDGASLGGWAEFFKELVRKQADFTISENEVIILLQTQSEFSEVAGEYDILEMDALYPSETLYPSEILYPGTITKEVSILD